MSKSKGLPPTKLSYHTEYSCELLRLVLTVGKSLRWLNISIEQAKL